MAVCEYGCGLVITGKTPEEVEEEIKKLVGEVGITYVVNKQMNSNKSARREITAYCNYKADERVRYKVCLGEQLSKLPSGIEVKPGDNSQCMKKHPRAE